VGSATIASSPSAEAAKLRLENETLFVLGLTPRSEYAVEIDDQELELVATDAAGTLVVPASGSMNTGVRIRLRSPAVESPAPDAIK
jgi:hypothetical protein